LFSHARPQAHEDLFGQIAEIKNSPVWVALVGRDLLERLDEFGSVMEIGDQV
jgi:hypothetical protein